LQMRIGLFCIKSYCFLSSFEECGRVDYSAAPQGTNKFRLARSDFEGTDEQYPTRNALL
jgi:hypothetical protein